MHPTTTLSLGPVSTKAAGYTRNASAAGQAYAFRRRWLHASQRRQAIMMPAMSPFMTEGTIKRWVKKEGDAFAPGDVLLQIESDVAMIDVEAHSPGIIGKILIPDGSKNIPVEQVIALVAKDQHELATLKSPSPSPALHLLPSRRSASTPTAFATSFPRTPRTPSLFEKHATSHGEFSARSVASPLFSREQSIPSSPALSAQVDQVEPQLDGAAIRRMIVSNLVRNSVSHEINDLV